VSACPSPHRESAIRAPLSRLLSRFVPFSPFLSLSLPFREASAGRISSRISNCTSVVGALCRRLAHGRKRHCYLNDAWSKIPRLPRSFALYVAAQRNGIYTDKVEKNNWARSLIDCVQATTESSYRLLVRKQSSASTRRSPFWENNIIIAECEKRYQTIFRDSRLCQRWPHCRRVTTNPYPLLIYRKGKIERCLYYFRARQETALGKHSIRLCSRADPRFFWPIYPMFM